MNFEDRYVDDLLKELNQFIDISDWNCCEKALSDAETCQAIVPSVAKMAKQVANKFPILTFCKFGRSPHSDVWTNFQIDLYEDGFLYYRGVNDVPILGERHAKISPQQTRVMIEQYKKRLKGYNSVDKRVMRRSFNKIRFYAQEGAFDIYPGTGLNMLLADLNNMVKIEGWFCFPKQHPMHQFCSVF
jgi:hypothetical protein